LEEAPACGRGSSLHHPRPYYTGERLDACEKVVRNSLE
jgi:hypothetical protein